MNQFTTAVLLCALCVCVLVRLSDASAWLMDPPGRSAMWNYGIHAQVNYNFRTLNCGGVPVQMQADGSRNCGICGDAETDPVPRANENGGTYYPSTILSRYYEAGQTAEISIWNNLPNTVGYYEFRMCTNGDNPTQSCLDQHLLTIQDSGNQTFIPVPRIQGLITLHVNLPVGVTCNHCMMQWRFRKENSFEGCDANNWCGVGRGPQIEYYNCADVAIGAIGSPKPDHIQDPTYDVTGHTNDTTTTGPSGHGSTQGLIAPLAIPTVEPVIIVNAGTGTAVNAEIFGGGGSSILGNNAQLLLLLGLLPVLGAIGRKINQPPPHLPPAGPATGFWVQTPPLSQYYMGTSFGFGNLGNVASGSSNYPVPPLLGGNSGRLGNSFGFSTPILGNQQQNNLVWSASNSNFGGNMIPRVSNLGLNGNMRRHTVANTMGNISPLMPSESSAVQNTAQRLLRNGNFGNNFGTPGVSLKFDNNNGNTFQSPSVVQTSGNPVFNGISANLQSVGNGFNQGTNSADYQRTFNGQYMPNNGIAWGGKMDAGNQIPPAIIAPGINNFNNHQLPIYPQQTSHNSHVAPVPTSIQNTGWHGNGWQGNNWQGNSGQPDWNINGGQFPTNIVNTNGGQLSPTHQQTDSRSIQGQNQIFPDNSIQNNVIQSPDIHSQRTSTGQDSHLNTNPRVNPGQSSRPLDVSRPTGKSNRIPQVHELYHQLINSFQRNQWGNQQPQQGNSNQGPQLTLGIPQRAL